MKRSDLVSILEAAYAVEDKSDRQWLHGVVSTILPHVPKALGANAFLYDTTRKPMRVWSIVNEGSPLDSKAVAGVLRAASDEYIEHAWKKTPCGTAAEVPGFDSEDGPRRFFFPNGVYDVFTVNAYNPVGVGCNIGLPLSAKMKVDKNVRALWSRVSAHVAAGFRLRLRLRGLREKPDAILTPSGKVVHAEKSAQSGSARVALERATDHIERARGKMRKSDAEAAVFRWRALVAARWTLLDHFEKGGRRYLLARSNEPSPYPFELLTVRERQVVALSTVGHHAKLIAYELGISHSTVRVLLARAARKLGARKGETLA